MKQEEGFVLKLDGDTALVQVGRHESCESCGACAAAEGPQTVVAENPISAKPGQHVRFTMHEEGFVKAAFIIFVMPLILAAVGAFCGWRIAYIWEANMTIGAVIGGCIMFVAGWAGVKKYDAETGRRHGMKPVITEIVA